jgi:hypothetical protein
MTSEEVAKRFNVASITVRAWALDNNVSYIGEGRRKTYQWTEEDCLRFSKRQGKGWKKGRARK